MNDHRPPRVLLADGDNAVRRALTVLLHITLGLHIVGEAADLTGLTAPSPEQADLLLIDWTAIVPEAAQRLAQLRALNNRLLIIVLSTKPEDREAALAAGANAFISKVDAPEQVLATVRAVLSADGSV